MKQLKDGQKKGDRQARPAYLHADLYVKYYTTLSSFLTQPRVRVRIQTCERRTLVRPGSEREIRTRIYVQYESGSCANVQLVWSVYETAPLPEWGPTAESHRKNLIL